MATDYSERTFVSKAATRKLKNAPEEKPKTNRKAVLLVILISVFLSFFFWKRPALSRWWAKLSEPATYEIINPEVMDPQLIRITENLHEPSDVVAGIKELISGLQGTYGVYVQAVEIGEEYGLNQGEVYTAASVNKVLVMAKVLQAIDKGAINFSDQYRLTAGDVQDWGTGSLRYAKLGTIYTYDELLRSLGKQSDNTAEHVLKQAVGVESIQALAAKQKMSQTSIKENETTPAEMGRFYAAVFNGEILSKSGRDKFYSYLTRTDFEDRIPAGVPDYVSVVHKIGNEVQTYNDCGLVFVSRNPYVLCILSKEVKEAEALEVLPKISRLVWVFESNR